MTRPVAILLLLGAALAGCQQLYVKPAIEAPSDQEADTPSADAPLDGTEADESWADDNQARDVEYCRAYAQAQASSLPLWPGNPIALRIGQHQAEAKWYRLCILDRGYRIIDSD